MPTTQTVTITSPTTTTVTTTVPQPTTITQTTTKTTTTTQTIVIGNITTITTTVTSIIFYTVTKSTYIMNQTGEQIIAQVRDVIIPAYYTASFSVDVDSGKTVKLSWAADNNLYVYIMTEAQYRSGWPILPSYYEAYKYGKEGTISTYSQYGGKYYMVFINLNLANVKLYEAKVTVT